MVRCGRARRWAGMRGLWSLRIFEYLPPKSERWCVVGVVFC